MTPVVTKSNHLVNISTFSDMKQLIKDYIGNDAAECFENQLLSIAGHAQTIIDNIDWTIEEEFDLDDDVVDWVQHSIRPMIVEIARGEIAW